MKQKTINFRDPVVERVVDKFVGRSDVGYKKYGVTLEEDPSEMLEWLNHLQEELMDAILYLEKIDDSNYAMQLLTITGANKDNFKLISDKISENINSLPFFKREQEKDITELENRSLAIIEAIKESDSLQKTYKQVLENSLDPENGFQTSITFEGSDEKNKTRGRFRN